MDFENCAPVQCRQCGNVSAYPNEQGYLCEDCGYALSWSFFKLHKLKCGCAQCLEDLQQEFWKKIFPYKLGQDCPDFQI